MILLPGFGCGLYEILRKPIPSIELRPVTDISSRGTTRNYTHGFLQFSRLNFGLEVLPNLGVTLPHNICIKIAIMPLYLVLMAVWFPFLPFIQYVLPNI